MHIRFPKPLRAHVAFEGEATGDTAAALAVATYANTPLVCTSWDPTDLVPQETAAPCAGSIFAATRISPASGKATGNTAAALAVATDATIPRG